MDEVSLLTAAAASGACLLLGAIVGFAVAASMCMAGRAGADDEYERGFEDGLARSYAPQPADVHGAHGDVPHLGGLRG